MENKTKDELDLLSKEKLIKLVLDLQETLQNEHWDHNETLDRLES